MTDADRVRGEREHPAPTVSVVVTTFSRRDLLDTCLASLAEPLDASATGSELIVVDDGDQAGLEDEVAGRHGGRLIRTAGAVGFAAAAQTAIGEARGDWVLLLNDDVTVEAGTIDALLEAAAARPDVASVAAQMRFATRPSTINSAGIEVDRLGIASTGS